MSRNPYSAAELAWLKANCTMTQGEYARAFSEEFGRKVSIQALTQLRKSRGWRTGRTGRFTPGRAVGGYQPIGAERLERGYLMRKVNDGPDFKKRWRLVHILNWEAVNGPIPAGYCLKASDGDKANTAAENWLLIPRAMLPALNGGRTKKRPAYDEAAPEIRPALLALATLEHGALKARERVRDAEPADGLFSGRDGPVGSPGITSERTAA